MSMFYCESCELYLDSDFKGYNMSDEKDPQYEKGPWCDNCVEQARMEVENE